METGLQSAIAFHISFPKTWFRLLIQFYFIKLTETFMNKTNQHLAIVVTVYANSFAKVARNNCDNERITLKLNIELS